MVVRRGTYPQVEPRAAELMTRAIVVVPRALPIAEAARVVRQRRARLVLARLGSRWAGAAPATLERALALGLARVALDTVLWGAPALGAETTEVTVRRRLGPATPFTVVVEGGQPVGAVLAETGVGRALPRSASAALARLDGRTLELLRTAGRLGAQAGWRVAAVGGVPRDLLGGRLRGEPRDLDLAVEGDGRELARRLGRALGGRAREHPAFLTATVGLPDGRGIDVATARREGYRRPGALPDVEPATLDEDLARRDFSVNALAVRVDGPGWGEVLDPTAGLADLDRRRIRVLHPLSFVEDPTRIFRAGRFAERLGFAIEPTTRRLLAGAAGLTVYAALSGDRLMAELEAILGEPSPAAVLTRLGRAGAFRLGAPEYRFPVDARERLARVEACVRELPVTAAVVPPLYLLALSAHLDADDAETWLARWGLPTRWRAAIARARRDGPQVARRLGREAQAGAAYAATRGVPELAAAWACVVARGTRVRRYVAEYLGRWRALPPLLSGDDLKTLGLTPGPLFGKLLEAARRAQVAGRLRSHEEATAWVRRLLARGDAPSETTNGSNPEPKGG